MPNTKELSGKTISFVNERAIVDENFCFHSEYIYENHFRELFSPMINPSNAFKRVNASPQ